jgi:23S rRNA pseudouridine2605 synthase
MGGVSQQELGRRLREGCTSVLPPLPSVGLEPYAWGMPSRSHRRTPKSHPPLAPRSQGGPERLQKILAAAGLGSRRQCEELIATGRVEVDRRVVAELGTRVDPSSQQIRVDGVLLSRPKLVYYAVNKPTGVLSTNRDPSGRPRVVDLVPDREARLFTIGRLDLHSEGLILVTNDGELANRLTHPRYGVAKTYRVVVAGQPTRDILTKLVRGVHLAEGVARAARVDIKSVHSGSTVMEMVLREGKNREIRRILARVGHKVERLTRIAVGPVRLGNLPVGACRRLTREEVALLRREAKPSRTPSVKSARTQDNRG